MSQYNPSYMAVLKILNKMQEPFTCDGARWTTSSVFIAPCVVCLACISDLWSITRHISLHLIQVMCIPIFNSTYLEISVFAHVFLSQSPPGYSWKSNYIQRVLRRCRGFISSVNTVPRKSLLYVIRGSSSSLSWCPDVHKKYKQGNEINYFEVPRGHAQT